MRIIILTIVLGYLAYSTLIWAPPAYAQTITLSSSPDCVSWGQDRIDCVARRIDNALWHDSWSSGSWNGWESFGGILTSGPSITSPTPGRLDMFASLADKQLWHIYWDGTLHQWESLGSPSIGTITSDPDCVTYAPTTDRVYIGCFARGPDNALWHVDVGEGKNSWVSQHGILTSGPGVSSQGPDQGDVFVRGPDNAMWQLCLSDNPALQCASDSWESRGGILTSDPDAVSWGQGRIDTVVKGPYNGPNTGIWHKYYDGGVWSTGWESLWGLNDPKGGPTIVSRSVNSLDVFELGTDNNLYHIGGNGTMWNHPWDAVPMTLAPAATTTSSSLVTTSMESSIMSSSSAVTSILTEESNQTSSSPTANPSYGVTDLTGILQQRSVLVVGVIVLILILAIFASRTHRRRAGSQGFQRPRTSVYCPQCGVQIPANSEFCAKCGGKVYD